MASENKKNYRFIVLYITIAIISGIWIGRFTTPKNNVSNQVSTVHFDKISTIFNLIQDNYVDTVDYFNLVEDALASIMQHLDPHSVYIPLEEFQAANDQIMGSFEGIGVQFRIEKDTVLVVQTIANGPSEKIGIRAGDRIVEVDGENIAGKGIDNNKVMKLLKGKKGTKVVLGIKRADVPGLINFTVIRDVIPTYSIDYYGMINPEIGYIKLSSFNIESDREFVNALNKLKSQGMKNLIFDLRGNGGGALNSSIRILDQLFEEDILLVYTQGLHRSKREYLSTKRGSFKKGKVIVLIDEFSASASEIVAGAVQDNDRGIVIGRRSFGKGLVQEQKDFKDGSAIRLTTARYYTPLGRSIQREYGKGAEAYYNEFYDRIISDIDIETDTAKHDSIAFITPSGKKVYGGGGITPDILVEHNKMLVSNKALNMYFSQLFPFAFDYTDKNRKSLTQKYRNAEAFVNNFSITPAIWAQYFDFVQKNIKSAEKTNLNLNPDERNFVEIHLKANIGRNLFNYDAYYPVVRDADEILKAAIEQIKKN